jgi:hypothetical protein
MTVLTATSHWLFSEPDESNRHFTLFFFKAAVRNLFYTMDPFERLVKPTDLFSEKKNYLNARHKDGDIYWS